MVYVTEESARFHAVLSAYLSIAAGLVEASLSLMSGHAEVSMSLYGIALMAFVDATGSVLVLMMWQGSSGEERLVSERLREMRYSIAIGSLMMFLGVFLIADSIKSLSEKESPSETNGNMGEIVAIFGSVCGIALAIYKYVVGKALDSPVIVADSVSSLCSGLTSVAALLVIIIDDKYWWTDSTAGFTAALYTLYSGAETIMTSYSAMRKLENPNRRRNAPEVIKRTLENYKNGYQRSKDGEQLLPNSKTRLNVADVPPATAVESTNVDKLNSNGSSFFGLFSFIGLFQRNRNGGLEYESLPLTESDNDEVTFSA